MRGPKEHMKEREVRLEHRLSFCGLVETTKVKAVNNEKVLKNISRDWEGASQLLTLITGIQIYIYTIYIASILVSPP